MKPDFSGIEHIGTRLRTARREKGLSQEQLADSAHLLALNLAHYQLRFGELPLANFAKLMETQTLDDETARLVAVEMENLVGVLGLVTTQDEAANDQKH